MTSKAYEAAIGYATDAVKAFLENEDLIEREGVEEEMLRWGLDLRYVDIPDGGIVIDGPEPSLLALCGMAYHDQAARRVALSMVAGKLIHGYALIPAEARLAGFALNGSLPKPKAKRGRKKLTNFERNKLAFGLAHHIRDEFGLPLTRNDASKKPQSACDAVSAAFIACNRHEVTYKTIKDVCLNPQFKQQMIEIMNEISQSNARVEGRGVVDPSAPECD